jgi:hypothetical protein
MDQRADQLREDLTKMISVARAAEPGRHADTPEQVLAPDDS